MKSKEVILKSNCNVFGLNLDKGSKIYIEHIIGNKESSLICETKSDNNKIVTKDLLKSFDSFNYTADDFIKEANRINDSCD